jgi:hypothetical protein
VRNAVLPLLWALVLDGSEVRAGRAFVEPSMKAIVLDVVPDRVALIVSDSGEWDTASVAVARRGIESATGIPPSHVILAATRPGAPKPAPAKAIEAARVAAGSLMEAVISTGTGREESVSFYRRFLMKDGSVRPDPSRGDPEIVQPAGEADPELHWLQVDSVSGAPLAAVITFALSAELAPYPAMESRVLSKLLGPGVPALITVAPAANLSPVDVRARDLPSAARIGTVLAAESLKAWARAKPLAPGRLRVLRETVNLAGEVEAEVQVLAYGSRFALVALPGDVFAELGMAIRRASPYPETVVIAFANAGIGIVPALKAFKEGGPDVRRARIQPGGGEQLAETALRMLGMARRAH